MEKQRLRAEQSRADSIYYANGFVGETAKWLNLMAKQTAGSPLDKFRSRQINRRLGCEERTELEEKLGGRTG